MIDLQPVVSRYVFGGIPSILRHRDGYRMELSTPNSLCEYCDLGHIEKARLLNNNRLNLHQAFGRM
ncbi:hypothetical protein TcasGA2_TC004537 [Tribolium castaneum]|uniref:Uncharacterized protein n=1 Tax=Tribolium castaneum TaxID=7070 RepID=D6WB03_TRICA|nr:hypothetical protein TcasGA2_TC004537 [Tribolium castaneum]